MKDLHPGRISQRWYKEIRQSISHEQLEAMFSSLFGRTVRKVEIEPSLYVWKYGKTSQHLSCWLTQNEIDVCCEEVGNIERP